MPEEILPWAFHDPASRSPEVGMHRLVQQATRASLTLMTTGPLAKAGAKTAGKAGSITLKDYRGLEPGIHRV